jgi:hypothetical protein
MDLDSLPVRLVLDPLQQSILTEGVLLPGSLGQPLVLFSAAQARTCLSGRRVTFSGDSVTSLVFIGLANILVGHHGSENQPIGVGERHEWVVRLRQELQEWGATHPGQDLGNIDLVCSGKYSPKSQKKKYRGSCYEGFVHRECANCLNDIADIADLPDAVIVSELVHMVMQGKFKGCDAAQCMSPADDGGKKAPSDCKRGGMYFEPNNAAEYCQTSVLEALDKFLQNLGNTGGKAVATNWQAASKAVWRDKLVWMTPVNTRTATFNNTIAWWAPLVPGAGASSSVATLLGVPVIDLDWPSETCSAAWQNCSLQKNDIHRAAFFNYISGQIVLNKLCNPPPGPVATLQHNPITNQLRWGASSFP